MSNLRFKIIEGTRSAAQSVFAHRFRSFLTTLGIIIGVASVIAVVSVVQGFSANVSAQFDGIGTNVISIDRYTPPKSRLQGKYARLTYEDFLKIKYQVPGASNVTPNLQMWGSNSGVTYRGQSVSTRIFGTASTYQKLEAVYCEQGRFFNVSDDESRRRVALIGPSLASKLEIQGNPIGQHISILGEWFKVICVTEKKGKLFGFDQDDFSLKPKERKSRDQIVISHTGSLSMSQNPLGLFESVKDHNDSSSGSKIKIQLVGSVHPNILDTIQQLNIQQYVSILSYQPHQKAIQILMDSDFIFLVVPNQEKNKGIIPGKIFEYFKCQSEIILIGNKRSDAALLTKELGYQNIFEINEKFDFNNLTINQSLDQESTSKFERKNLTASLAQVFDEINA